jgi:hypothetical protein
MAVTITVGELERATFEVRMFIGDLLSEYVVKVPGVKVPPLWDLGPVWPPQYYPRVKKILIPEKVAVLWAVDKEKTKTALRWAVAHEFWHYVQEVRGERGIPILDFRVVAEYIAGKQAIRLSGVTAAEGLRLWKELLAYIY